MRRTTIIAAALALAALLPAAPAHALRARVYVSKTGADAGGCSFTAPCQSLDFALNAVEDSGEITILDSGGYNPITITKGVTITVPPGVEAGIAVPPSGYGIIIEATQGDAVILRGLTLAGANSGAYGIDILSAGKIEIVDCVIRDFKADGIYIAPNNNTLVHISNTKVMNNAATGIHAVPPDSVTVTADFDHLTVIDNNDYGIVVNSGMNLVIANSDVSNNGTGTGCNVWVGGRTNILAIVQLRNVTLGHSVSQSINCSITQNDWSEILVSQVMGGEWMQPGTTQMFVDTDGTNLMQVPAGAQAWVKN